MRYQLMMSSRPMHCTGTGSQPCLSIEFMTSQGKLGRGKSDILFCRSVRKAFS